MATSTNYLWTEPNDSDLVKNGAAAIRTLGNAIDASLWNSGFGQAGKNKVINADCNINQRATTSTTTSGTFLVDRFKILLSAAAGSVTGSVQQFTTGSAPVAGYEAKQYLRVVTTGQAASTDRALISQAIEDVRTFAGQTATISFWAKAATGTPNVAIEFAQTFGTGGSPSASISAIGAAKTAISTSWARYSFSVAIPSISGKTIGTDANTSTLSFSLWVSAGSSYDARTATLGVQNNTFDIWGVQVEYGSTATPFQTASGGSPQAELAMCQRYFLSLDNANTNTLAYGYGWFFSITSARYMLPTPVTMRATPTLTGALIIKGAATSLAPTTYGVYLLGQGIGVISAVTGGVQDNAIAATFNSTLTLSAEL